MNHETEYLILGGGPTGLGAASRLQERGLDWQLLEAEDHVGGLSASFVDEQGFTWDLGGHVQFSHYETFDRYMKLALGADGWLTHQRESWIWLRDRFVPYPFQNNLHRLDVAERDRCLDGLKQAAAAVEQARPANFAEWMLATFGRGICDLFMVPYNLKVWAYPASQLDYHWIGERVAVPDLNAVMTSIRTGQDQVSWGPNRVFHFPKRGGTGAIWSGVGRLLAQDRVHLNARVERIDVRKKTVRTEDGTTWNYRWLITTMPLDVLIRCAPGVVDAQIADRLVYSDTNVVGVGIVGQPPAHLNTKCWMYFPGNNSPYYRVTVFSHYSAQNVARPGEQWSLMTESSESTYRKVDHPRLAEHVVRALREDGLMAATDEICTLAEQHIPHAYPTPFLGRDALVDPILRRFEDVGIFSRGRFGAWKYEVANQDHSFAQGYECVERLALRGGSELEPTLFTPSVVNSRRNP